MTAQKTLKRQIRARMLKTGESYTGARRHFRTVKDSLMKPQSVENPRTRIANQFQPGLWPDWIEEHSWLKTFLPKAEAEARNFGAVECNRGHLILAFLRLPSPVPNWFDQLHVNTTSWMEDVIFLLGMHTDGDLFNLFLKYGSRLNKARKSSNPLRDVPLKSTTQDAVGMLDLARSEAQSDGTTIDERHFFVSVINWCQYSDPTEEELRRITGRQ